MRKQMTSLIRRFLGYSLRLDVARSLQPFADFYFNFGRILTNVFVALKLIDRSHPWARCGAAPRPLEVLAYACARVQWNKPWQPQAVLVGTITLLVGLGGFAATSMTLAVLIGAGDAYAASMFTATSPATDLALKYLSNGFGVPITGVPVAAVDGVVEGFQKMMALYSTAMLLVAGFILFYIITSAIAATAHEGRFGGSSFNQIWAPIRLVVAIGLLVPMPMAAGFNGYNSGQYIVMKMAEFGSGLATNLWVPFATSLADKLDTIATPSVEPAAEAVLGVLRNEFCRSRYNKINADLGLGEPVVQHKSIVHGGVTTIFYTTDSDTTNAFCGTVRYEKSVSTGGLATNISNGFETEFNKMVTQVQGLASDLNEPTTIDLTGALPGAGNELNIKSILTTKFVKIVVDYQTALGAVLDSTMAAQISVANNEMTTQIEDAGWAGASLWFNAIARINGEIMAAARGIPVSSDPDLKFGTSGPSTAGQAYLLDNLKKGMDKFNEYGANLGALIPSYMGSSTVGAGATASGISTSSVVSGLSNKKTGATGAGSALIGSILKDAFASGGGPFGQIGQGAESNLSQINPLASLAAIGEWIVDKSLALLIGAGLFTVIVPTAASMFLFLIAITGFGAGVLLFYVLPLLPFIRSMFAIVGWLLNVLEALIAIPLISVAHLSTKGEGISGDLSRTAYFMIFSIFLRPALLIVGLITALMMFTLAVGILNDMYKAAIKGFLGTATGDVGGGLSVIMYTMLYCVIAYMLCNLCFKLIEDIPNKAMTWIGQQASREISQDESVARVMSGHSDTFLLGTRNAAGTIGQGGGLRLPTRGPRPVT